MDHAGIAQHPLQWNAYDMDGWMDGWIDSCMN